MDTSVSVDYLDLFRDVLRNYLPPSGPFEPAGRWFHQYRLYTVVNGDIPVPPVRGTLRIERVPQDAGGAILNINYEKTSRYAGVHTFLATVVCANDHLSTPLKWSSTYTAAAPARPLKMSLEQMETGVAGEGSVIISQGREQKKLSLPSAYTSNWALFDAVQRLERSGGAALRFTLLDDDAPKPDQVLAFYQSTHLRDRWPGAPDIRVHGFLQIGEGTTPQVYWVDDRGELLFLVSGLNAFVLDNSTYADKRTGSGRS
jgi:hypothetical protein